MKNNYSNFEDFLKEKHADDYHGTDDDMGDNYESWLTDLQLDEVIAFADEYGELKRLEGKTLV